MIAIRKAMEGDCDAIWAILEPVLRAGEVFALPREMTREQALAYWTAPSHSVFVAELGGEVVGSYYLRANQQGGGDHVCNCGYVTDLRFQRHGVARWMCEHSLQYGKQAGFRAMQFNLVVETNAAAVHLWGKCGFAEVGRLPGAFRQPELGFVDALVMWREL
jgi:RimJ/RimL family protein N-acetyltransferase